ncbi:MAG: mechanosensitive ion channel family protein [Phycisphaerales bacterium]|nr:mechanosensitive ion channel family protein [Phycisphaerales bacterium]
MHSIVKLIMVVLAVLCVLVSPVLSVAWDEASPADTAASKDISAPGEAPLPERQSKEDHPWTIVEKTPPFENSRQSVKPERLDSPRSVMWSLGRTLNTYRDILGTVGRTYKSEPRLRWIQGRIAQCFDLSDVGPQFQNDVATDAAVYLREIMRRIPMSAWETIPDQQDIEAMPDDEKITRYRFDYVPIELMLLTEGDRAGEWVITTDTRDTAQAAYDHVKHIEPIAGVGELYRRHFFEPGWLIPSSLINHLPTWTGYEIFEQAIWQWAITLASLGVVSAVVIGIILLLRKRCRRPMTIKGRIAHLAFLLFLGVTASAFIDFLQLHVFLSGAVLEVLTFFFSAIMLVAFILGLLVFGVLVAEIVIASPRINPRSLDAALIRVAARAISIFLAAVVFFKILGQLGLSPATVLAGAGVTGLAIALGAQDALKNFFASITLLMERPFREGERIRIGDDVGTVETIGLRSTSIRTRAGNVVSLPNETVAHGRIENISRRPHIRSELKVGIVYSTPVEKVEQAIQIIRDILDKRTQAPASFSPLVHFTRFEDSSLLIDCSYWQSTTDYAESRDNAQCVNLDILDQFNSAGIEFAYPTVTIVGGEKGEAEGS